MSLLLVASLALALGQAPPPDDLEALIRLAREIPPANDAESERAALEKTAAGYKLTDVRVVAAPEHTSRSDVSLRATGASLQCHDVTARGSLVSVAYFVPMAVNLLRPAVLESLEIVSAGTDDLTVTMRVAFPALQFSPAEAAKAERLLALVREQPRPVTALLRLAARTKDDAVRVTRVRHADALEIDAVAVGGRARDALAAALAPAGIRGGHVAPATRGGCQVLRVTGQAAPATRDEETAARDAGATLDPFLQRGATPCPVRDGGTPIVARRRGTAADGIHVKARGASRGEALALLEMATGRPMIGGGATAARVDLDLAGVSADEAIAALRDAGAPLKAFGAALLWTDVAGPFRVETYTGEPVTFAVDCAEVRALLGYVGSSTGLEFRIDDAVTGCVDAFATDRPWDEVLEGVIAAAGLRRRIEGTTVFVEPAGAGAAAAAPPSKWEVPLDRLEPGDLQLFGLARTAEGWRALAHGPAPGRHELAAGTKLAGAVVTAVDASGVTVDAGGRTVRLTLP